MKDYFDSWGRTRCSGRSRCREVSTKAILWTVRQDKTSGRLQRMPSVEVRVHDFTIKYRLALLTWYKHVLRARVVSDMSRRSQFSLHANGD